jgi:hypothetical protein
VKRDILKAGAMLAALTTMAPAEYQLGLACGFGHLAAGLPASLDIYTLRAIRTGRDVPAVAVAMVAVNAASHLIAAGRLAVTWYLIIAVSALPVLVLVRVERLGKGLHTVEAGEPELAVPEFVAAPEPAEVSAEPAPEPVVLERVPEDEGTSSNLDEVPALGPWVPVAELLGGTGRDQAFPGATEVPEPAGTSGNLPEVPPAPQPEPDPVPPGVSAEHVTAVRMWLKTEPKLTGTAIGTRLGTSDSYGRRVRRAALAVTA